MHDVIAMKLFLVFMLTFFVQNPSRLPIYMMADVIQVARKLAQRLRSFRRYRRISANMEARFPDATDEEIERNEYCVICRDSLFEGSKPKKLGCGHIFHIDCLRSWIVMQQVCPTCRAEIPPDAPPGMVPQAPAEVPAAAAPAVPYAAADATYPAAPAGSPADPAATHAAAAAGSYSGNPAAHAAAHPAAYPVPQASTSTAAYPGAPAASPAAAISSAGAAPAPAAPNMPGTGSTPAAASPYQAAVPAVKSSPPAPPTAARPVGTAPAAASTAQTGSWAPAGAPAGARGNVPQSAPAGLPPAAIAQALQAHLHGAQMHGSMLGSLPDIQEINESLKCAKEMAKFMREQALFWSEQVRQIEQAHMSGQTPGAVVTSSQPPPQPVSTPTNKPSMDKTPSGGDLNSPAASSTGGSPNARDQMAELRRAQQEQWERKRSSSQILDKSSESEAS
eukprot:gnl/TRDRNA2_/TRDRNA2_158360_c0_seq2.p1 gnl/TRDRNA2_/TRDRNA2_158360_c0~~gnl/TRDRNA2_/TRDRNA2_158360_c0_seq2.p1  ORF type:complete len:449 (-),score=70.38 gnl/TRDRNA2_/TRDRNA2_158360_c0_seq2:75-1421(-)